MLREWVGPADNNKEHFILCRQTWKLSPRQNSGEMDQGQMFQTKAEKWREVLLSQPPFDPLSLKGPEVPTQPGGHSR